MVDPMAGQIAIGGILSLLVLIAMWNWRTTLSFLGTMFLVSAIVCIPVGLFWLLMDGLQKGVQIH